MRKHAWLMLAVGLVFGVGGCGDDNSSNGGAAGSGGSGGGTATISGIVYQADDADGMPFQGATVSVVGGASTTSGVGGTFSLEAPVGPSSVLTTAAGHWGELLVGDVPASGINDLEPEVVPDALVDQVAGELGETVDRAKAIVAVEFGSPAAGNTADLGVSFGFAFVFNANGDAVPGTQILPGGGNEVIFANVDVSADAMPTATNASNADCAPDYPNAAYPSQAKVITTVFMVCP